MAWGGSLNPKGSDYVKRVREAEKTIDYLNNIKNELLQEERKTIEDTIEIIENFILDLSEKMQKS